MQAAKGHAGDFICNFWYFHIFPSSTYTHTQNYKYHSMKTHTHKHPIYNLVPNFVSVHTNNAQDLNYYLE
jgi:hypothetical protein